MIVIKIMMMVLIRDLVQFFIESELHEHGAYLVDSLIESNPMMKARNNENVKNIKTPNFNPRTGSA